MGMFIKIKDEMFNKATIANISKSRFSYAKSDFNYVNAPCIQVSLRNRQERYFTYPSENERDKAYEEIIKKL